MRPLVLIMPKMSEYNKRVKVIDWNKDQNNKLIFFRIYKEKLLEKYRTIWTKIGDFKDIELNALPFFDDI